MDEDEYIGEWYPYEEEITLGGPGPQGGVVLRDEEYGVPEDLEDAHARLTLERDAQNPEEYLLTATLYGWMFLVRRVADLSAAEADYEALRSELERLATLFPYEEDGEEAIEEKAARLTEAIAGVEKQYATT